MKRVLDLHLNLISTASWIMKALKIVLLIGVGSLSRELMLEQERGNVVHSIAHIGSCARINSMLWRNVKL